MARTLPGVLLAGGWLLLLLLGTPALFGWAVLAIAILGGDEYLRMAWRDKVPRISRLVLVFTLCLPVTFVMSQPLPAALLAGVVAAFFLQTLYFLWRYTHFEDCYERFSRLVFGIVYIGVLASFLVMIRQLPAGGNWLVVLTAVTASSDTGAYLAGRRFGKHKLCPGISPKKTIEGALGGLVCGLSGALVASLLLLPEAPVPFVLLAAAILTGVGILGDLTESIIKRGTGTKDSGRLLAGHGGVLDRIDSLLLTAPVFFYLLQLTGTA